MTNKFKLCFIILLYQYFLISSSKQQNKNVLSKSLTNYNRYRFTRYGDVDNCGKRKRNVENRKCFRQCSSDLDCRGSKRRCLCDGECGLSCVRITTACPKVTDFKNGFVNYLPDNYFGSQLIYECNSGFTLIGNKVRICEGDGWWSGNSPICLIEKFCDPPESVLNAIPNVQVNNQSKYKIGTEVEYQCDIGFTSTDTTNKIICQEDARWSQLNFKCNKISCGKPDEIENGYYKGNDFFYSGVVEYKCMSGYKLKNGDYLRECDLDGKWSGRKPSCEPVDCGQPPYVSNAISIYNSTLFGNRVKYSCISDRFKLIEPSTHVVCMPNGRWHDSLPKCIEKTCTLDSNEYGKQIYDITPYNNHLTYSINSNIRISCNTGYVIDGPNEITCYNGLIDGLWSIKLPTCRAEILCSFISPPENGLIHANKQFRKNGYPINTTLEFTCQEGFKLYGSKYFNCASNGVNGEWMGDRPECIKEVELVSTSTITTTLAQTQTQTNDLLFKPNEKDQNKKQEQISIEIVNQECKIDQSSMLISYTDTIASPTQSANDFVFINATIGSFIKNDESVTYNCKNNNITTYIAKCMNGTLLMQQNCNELTKSQKSCSPPPKIANGYNKYGSSLHGSKALYQCFNGYELSKGHSELKCSNGEWIGSVPVCSKINCAFPGVLENGKIFYIGTLSEYTYHPYMNTVGQNKQIRYECDIDYKLVGPNGSTCINGNWKPSIKLVKCVKELPLKSKVSIDDQNTVYEEYSNEINPSGSKITLYRSKASKLTSSNTNNITNEEKSMIKKSLKLKRLKKHRSKSNSTMNKRKKSARYILSDNPKIFKSKNIRKIKKLNHVHHNKDNIFE